MHLLLGIGLLLLAVIAVLAGIGRHFSLPFKDAAKQVARVAAAPILAVVYRKDAIDAGDKVATYTVGDASISAGSMESSWKRVADSWPEFRFLGIRGGEGAKPDVPFVYETTDAAHLKKLREVYQLEQVIGGAATEYEAMLRLGAWLGEQWDHGTDPVPGGNLVCDPVAVINAGRKGSRFWCEIAARTLVHAATSLGWQARLISGSRDGYTWEHAVAEIWSNQFGKWFVVDADFNVVYESGGVPLSAFELSRQGEQLARRGSLNVRQIATPKPSLPPADVLPFYGYVHVDLRNDWCSRPLRSGSPAGGDRNTWWTARPSFNPVLTAKRRVDDQRVFDWLVNPALVQVVAAESEGNDGRLLLSFAGYGPTAIGFEIRSDGGSWERLPAPTRDLAVQAGRHTLETRLVTSDGQGGPVTTVEFEIGSGTRSALAVPQADGANSR